MKEPELMLPQIVFCDVDGTLLTSHHEILPGTLYAIRKLQTLGIPFVIVSARSPSGIYPLFAQYDFSCPMICYSGALILSEERHVLHSAGMTPSEAKAVISYIETKAFDCSWNLYAMDQWIVRDKTDPRIIREETIVHTSAAQGSPDLLSPKEKVGKILCICNPEKLLSIEEALRARFPQLSIARSSDILLEIMAEGITKRTGLTTFCTLCGIPPEKAAAFGDHFNDREMLETVGLPFVMGNAPTQLKQQFPHIAKSNDEEGIYHALCHIGLIP